MSTSIIKRFSNRRFDQIRPLEIVLDVAGNADGSVMLTMGNTKVICTVTLVHQIPSFLRNKRQWWLTASYALMPASTGIRTEREALSKRNDRSAEIARLIGRSLRAVVDLPCKTEEKTIHIDCDVLQADGGTRTACITAAYVALKFAEQRWLSHKIISQPLIRDEVAAISVGWTDTGPLLDLDFSEDSSIVADFNYILTRDLRIIEIQGSSEQHAISWDAISSMYKLACSGIQQIFFALDKHCIPIEQSLVIEHEI